MGFKVKIIRNDTGEVIVDHDNCKAIMGAFALEDHVNTVSYLRCNSITLASVVEALQKLLQMTSEDHPELLLLAQMKDLMEKFEKERSEE